MTETTYIGIDITDRGKSKPLPLWTRNHFGRISLHIVAAGASNRLKAVAYVALPFSRTVFSCKSGEHTQCIYMYVRTKEYPEGRRKTKRRSGERPLNGVTRDKAIISALSGPNQANQPPTASPPPPSPTSSRTPALSSPNSSFAPCAFAPTPCMQANPLPLRLPKEAAASVHPRRAPTSNSLSLPCIFRQGNRNFPLTGLPHELLETTSGMVLRTGLGNVRLRSIIVVF